MYPKWRWVICPVVLDGSTRKPLVGILENPDGRLPSAGFTRAQVISSGLPWEENDWCLCRVKIESAEGEAVLAARPEIVPFPEFDCDRRKRKTSLDETPRQRGLTREQVEDIKTRLGSVAERTKGAARRIKPLTEDSRVRDFLDTVGKRLDPNFDPAEIWAG